MIAFSPIGSKDLELLQKWRNSDLVRPNCREHRLLNEGNMQTWLYEMRNDPTQDFMLINYKRQKIGVTGLTRIDQRNQVGEISFYVGIREFVISLVIHKALEALMEYAFNTKNLYKLYFPVYAFNPLLGIYRRIFETEAILKQEYYWDGRRWDRYYLTRYKNRG